MGHYLWDHCVKSSSPLGVVVDKNVVLHGQLKIWDLFTDPTRQREETCQVLLYMYKLYIFINFLLFYWQYSSYIHKTNRAVKYNCKIKPKYPSQTYRMVSMISCAASWCLSWGKRKEMLSYKQGPKLLFTYSLVTRLPIWNMTCSFPSTRNKFLQLQQKPVWEGSLITTVAHSCTHSSQCAYVSMNAKQDLYLCTKVEKKKKKKGLIHTQKKQKACCHVTTLSIIYYS